MWPFLIAASPDIDYDVVLCPDFVLKENERIALIKKFGQKLQTITSDIQAQSLGDPLWGELGAIYKVDRALRDGAELRDRSGRRIYRTYGLILRDFDFEGRRRQAIELFPDAERAANEVFAEFWSAGADFKPRLSSNIGPNAARTSSNTPLPYAEHPSPPMGRPSMFHERERTPRGKKLPAEGAPPSTLSRRAWNVIAPFVFAALVGAFVAAWIFKAGDRADRSALQADIVELRQAIQGLHGKLDRLIDELRR